VSDIKRVLSDLSRSVSKPGPGRCRLCCDSNMFSGV